MEKVKTVEELRERALAVVGIPFSKIDLTGRLSTGKGAIGATIEESWFGQKPHSDAKPDFADLGIELKVTPYVSNKGFKSKERLVCNMINYMTEYKHQSFEESSFYKKCNSMLMLFYEHRFDIPKSDYKISYASFITLSEDIKDKYNFFNLIPEEDKEIMRHDWETIVQKIRLGKAHELSESDTNYLGACTKASNSSIRVVQPFSDELAKPRAFSIKQSYMNYLLNNYYVKVIEKYEKPEDNEKIRNKIIKNVEFLKQKSFEKYIIEKITPHYGKTDVDLAKEFNIDTLNKGFRDRIIAAIFDIKGNINNSEEFQKASIISKTIRVEKNGKIKESMSFPNIDYHEIINEEWEDSSFYHYIGMSKFMFSIFEKDGDVYRMKKVKFWNMPINDLEEARQVWLKTKTLVQNNELIIGGKYGYSVMNFPKSSENRVSHVRPHDTNAKKGHSILPDGRETINYCFWLNNDYISKIISSD